MIHQHTLVLMFSPSYRITPPEYDLPAPISESYQLLKRQGRPHWARHASSSSPRKQVGKGFFNTRTRRKGRPAFKSPTQLAFDRSSILGGRSVRSLLPAALSCESKTTDGQGARTVLIRSRKSMTQVLQNLRATL